MQAWPGGEAQTWLTYFWIQDPRRTRGGHFRRLANYGEHYTPHPGQNRSCFELNRIMKVSISSLWWNLQKNTFKLLYTKKHVRWLIHDCRHFTFYGFMGIFHYMTIYFSCIYCWWNLILEYVTILEFAAGSGHSSLCNGCVKSSVYSHTYIIHLLLQLKLEI